MPNYSIISKRRLAECHVDLQRLFSEVIKHIDCSILCGHRNKEDQDRAHREGNSTKKWPNSKHNNHPSLAVDAAPYPINWQDKERFYYFAGIVKGVAYAMNIPIRWGGDWDKDHDLHDQNLYDLVHFEMG